MRIAVCDDEKHFLIHLNSIVNRLYNSMEMITDLFSDGKLLLQQFPIKKYDIVFLDIEMPGMDGITLAHHLRSMSEDVYIVFLTGHIEYAIQGYQVNALRYLTKPASESGIREVIDYVIAKQNTQKFLWVKNSEGEYRIRLLDIIFIEAQDQKIVVYTLNGCFEQRGKLNDYEAKLKTEGFFRIHRSYLVSLTKVVALRGKDVSVAGGYHLPVGRTKEAEFRNALVALINKEAF